MSSKMVVRMAVLLGVGGLVGGCGDASSHGAPTTRPADQPGPPVVRVNITEAGCVPTNFTLQPGDVVFSVTNTGTKVAEMEVQWPNGHVKGDVEGIQPGHTRSLAVNLQVGTYRVRCPESARTGGTITVQ